MQIEDVRRLDPVERFLYWWGERQAIYLRRQAGASPPWTDDEILQTNYFTNVYREQDRTTVWFREHVRAPWREDPRVIFATICFRWFNYIPTGERLIAAGLLDHWDDGLALGILGPVRTGGGKVFTGAFLIQSPRREAKLEAICRRITMVWDDRENLIARSRDWMTLEGACADLRRYDGLGGFMAYEIACDLRHTAVLDHATDVLTWSNPGPGAIRGLYRVLGWPLRSKSNSHAPRCSMEDYQTHTQGLLGLLRARHPDWPIEMREIEHSLCESDKYNRILFGEGRSKRKYNGRRVA